MKIKELIAELSKYDPEVQVFVSTHYDNGVGYSNDVSVYVGRALHDEGQFFSPVFEGDYADGSFELDENDPEAVFVLGSCY